MLNLRKNRSTRRTMLICTISYSTWVDHLELLAVSRMNVARINICHGTRVWHWKTVLRKRRLVEEKGYAVTIMMDTEENEIHVGDLGGASSPKAENLLRSFYPQFVKSLGLDIGYIIIMELPLS